MQNPLLQTIEALAKEKGIEAETIINAIEDAVLTASRKYYKTNENLKTRFNQETGQVDLFAIRQIVDEVTDITTQISLTEARELYGEEAELDMEIEFPKRTDVLGRIAAQTAKQVIFQKVREAERENIFAEYNQRVGEVLNSTIKRFENGDLIVEIGLIVDAALKRDFGLARPRIGLCGVNPHAGEDGEIGREEIEIINPAAVKLRARTIDISDARPGDTIFHEARAGRFDAVIAMYHDQGLIPVKTLDMWGGVNVTLGLPFIRTSPDHGVAYDAAAAGVAKAESLIAAIRMADEMAHARAAAQ